MTESQQPELLLARAQQGDGAALGSLLEGYRQYIELVARLQIDHKLQRKLSPSDVAQETFCQAYKSFEQFRGRTEGELLKWLRRIVASQMAMMVRHLNAQRRDMQLEQQLARGLDRSSEDLASCLRGGEPTPSTVAMRREQAVLLANALAELRPDHREVIILRHLEGLSFPEIAQQMGTTLDSVKNIWARAIGKLRQLTAEPQ